MKAVLVTVLVFFVGTSIANTTLAEFASGNNLFTAAVYKEIVKNKDENVLVSPLSVEAVLALAQSGAKNETAQEIRTVLHLPESDQKIRKTFKDLLHVLKGDENFSLHTANKLYVTKNVPIKTQFKQIATDDFLAEIENIDFSQSQQAADTMNQWVEKHTEHKIKNLVDPSSLSPNTPLVLINALHFKANWIDRDFHKYPLQKKNFYKTAQDVVDVDTMFNHAGRFNFYESKELGAKFLEIPFEGGEARMVFVLPNEKEGLGGLEQQTEKIFKVHDFKKDIVNVALPLFKIEATIDFNTILQQLGIKTAFTTNADFSGIAGNKGDLVVGGVMQKTFINVDQTGVEAAAATNLWFYLSGPPPPRQTFIADHPFIFYITVKDVILFAGKVSAPSH